MKKYCVDIVIKGDQTKYSIIGYEGLKKNELQDYVKDFIEKKELEFSKGNSLINYKGEPQGYYDIYSVEC